MNFTVVERSDRRRSRHGKYLDVITAVLETSETGKAVEVPAADADEYNRLQNAIRLYVSRHHPALAVRSMRNRETAQFWTEKR